MPNPTDHTDGHMAGPNSMRPPALSILQINASKIVPQNDAECKIFEAFLHILDALDDSPSGLQLNIINNLLETTDNLLDTVSAEKIPLSKWSDWTQTCSEYAKTDHLLYKYLAVDTDNLARQYHSDAKKNNDPSPENHCGIPFPETIAAGLQTYPKVPFACYGKKF